MCAFDCLHLCSPNARPRGITKEDPQTGSTAEGDNHSNSYSSVVHWYPLAMTTQNKGLDHSDPTANVAKDRLTCD